MYGNTAPALMPAPQMRTQNPMQRAQAMMGPANMLAPPRPAGATPGGGPGGLNALLSAVMGRQQAAGAPGMAPATATGVPGGAVGVPPSVGLLSQLFPNGQPPVLTPGAPGAAVPGAAPGLPVTLPVGGAAPGAAALPPLDPSLMIGGLG